MIVTLLGGFKEKFSKLKPSFIFKLENNRKIGYTGKHIKALALQAVTALGWGALLRYVGVMCFLKVNLRTVPTNPASFRAAQLKVFPVNACLYI